MPVKVYVGEREVNFHSWLCFGSINTVISVLHLRCDNYLQVHLFAILV